jgi:hypothetical protein
MARALDCSVSYHTQPTVNPLVYAVKITFGENPSSKNRVLLWNLIQKYASKNEAILQGRVRYENSALYFDVGVKYRLGWAKDVDPSA